MWVEKQTTNNYRKRRRVTPVSSTTWQNANEHLENSLTKITASHHPSSICFFSSNSYIIFFILSKKLRAASQSKEKISRSHFTGQSNSKMTGATGNSYLQILFIYLFRRYLKGLRKGRKAIFIFLMELLSTDNIPVLLSFSWISQATKCAGNAKFCSCSSTQTEMKPFFIRKGTISGSPRF